MIFRPSVNPVASEVGTYDNQLLSNFEPQKYLQNKQILGHGPSQVAYKKNVYLFPKKKRVLSDGSTFWRLPRKPYPTRYFFIRIPFIRITRLKFADFSSKSQTKYG